MKAASRPAVLVVEKDEALRGLLSAVLDREGYSVFWNDYRGALDEELLRCERYSAILVHVTPFPSPNDSSEHEGFYFLRELQARRPKCLRRTLALATTSRALPEPICKVLTAPFDLQEFVTAVRRADQGRSGDAK